MLRFIKSIQGPSRRSNASTSRTIYLERRKEKKYEYKYVSKIYVHTYVYLIVYLQVRRRYTAETEQVHFD